MRRQNRPPHPAQPHHTKNKINHGGGGGDDDHPGVPLHPQAPPLTRIPPRASSEGSRPRIQVRDRLRSCHRGQPGPGLRLPGLRRRRRLPLPRRHRNRHHRPLPPARHRLHRLRHLPRPPPPRRPPLQGPAPQLRRRRRHRRPPRPRRPLPRRLHQPRQGPPPRLRPRLLRRLRRRSGQGRRRPLRLPPPPRRPRPRRPRVREGRQRLPRRQHRPRHPRRLRPGPQLRSLPPRPARVPASPPPPLRPRHARLRGAHQQDARRPAQAGRRPPPRAQLQPGRRACGRRAARGRRPHWLCHVLRRHRGAHQGAPHTWHAGSQGRRPPGWSARLHHQRRGPNSRGRHRWTRQGTRGWPQDGRGILDRRQTEGYSHRRTARQARRQSYLHIKLGLRIPPINNRFWRSVILLRNPRAASFVYFCISFFVFSGLAM